MSACTAHSDDPNKEAIRRALNPDEIRQETKILLRQGHKRVLMVAGEAYPGSGIDYVLESIDAIYGAEENGSRIRRVNVNLAPLSVEDFRRLKERNIGTFQLFQETYHRPTYGRVHLAGPKKDLDWRASTTWAWGCSTGYMTGGSRRWSSWPTSRILRSGLGSRLSYHQRVRIEPAIGSDLASRPPYTLNDQDFLKLVAILRFQVMAALGFRLEDEEDDSTPLSVYAEKALEREQPSAPILTVCDTACQGCIPARYYVTDACQNCIAHPCIGSCHFGDKITVTKAMKSFAKNGM